MRRSSIQCWSRSGSRLLLRRLELIVYAGAFLCTAAAFARWYEGAQVAPVRGRLRGGSSS
jgi:hypothetical protein